MALITSDFFKWNALHHDGHIHPGIMANQTVPQHDGRGFCGESGVHECVSAANLYRSLDAKLAGETRLQPPKVVTHTHKERR